MSRRCGNDLHIPFIPSGKRSLLPRTSRANTLALRLSSQRPASVWCGPYSPAVRGTRYHSPGPGCLWMGLRRPQHNYLGNFPSYCMHAVQYGAVTAHNIVHFRTLLGVTCVSYHKLFINASWVYARPHNPGVALILLCQWCMFAFALHGVVRCVPPCVKHNSGSSVFE